MDEPPSGLRPPPVLAALACVVVLGGLVAAGLGLPVEAWLRRAADAAAASGTTGLVAFATLYVLLASLLVPAGILNVVATAAFGIPGAIFGWVAMMATSVICFLLARHGLRATVERALASRPRLRAVREVADDEGWRLVLLVRLSGIIPFGAQNYVFGITRIPLSGFLMATSVGVLPGILVAAAIGIIGRSELEGQASGLKLTVLAVGIVAGLTLLVIAGRKIRTRLRSIDRPAP